MFHVKPIIELRARECGAIAPSDQRINASLHVRRSRSYPIKAQSTERFKFMGYPAFGKVKTFTLPIPDGSMTFAQYKSAFGIDLQQLENTELILLKEPSGNIVPVLYYDKENAVLYTANYSVDISAGFEVKTDSLISEVIEKASTNLPMNNIVDEDGHKRFISGDITPDTITGVSFSYAKWALSGSHLIIVLAGAIADNTTLSFKKLAILNDIPQWVRDKITPSGDSENIVSSGFADEWVDSVNPLANRYAFFGLTKPASGNIEVSLWSTHAYTTGVYFRMTFDLLID